MPDTKQVLVLVIVPALLGLGGCATVNPAPDYQQARERIQRATGQPVTTTLKDLGADPNATDEQVRAAAAAADSAAPRVAHLSLYMRPNILGHQ